MEVEDYLQSLPSAASSSSMLATYTMDGVIQFLIKETTKVERERELWQDEKQQLLMGLSRLESEKKSQENLIHSLLRRIKMLEFSLDQEREKITKLSKLQTPDPHLKTDEGGSVEEEEIEPEKLNEIEQKVDQEKKEIEKNKEIALKMKEKQQKQEKEKQGSLSERQLQARQQQRDKEYAQYLQNLTEENKYLTNSNRRRELLKKYLEQMKSVEALFPTALSTLAQDTLSTNSAPLLSSSSSTPSLSTSSTSSFYSPTSSSTSSSTSSQPSGGSWNTSLPKSGTSSQGGGGASSQGGHSFTPGLLQLITEEDSDGSSSSTSSLPSSSTSATSSQSLNSKTNNKQPQRPPPSPTRSSGLASAVVESIPEENPLAKKPSLPKKDQNYAAPAMGHLMEFLAEKDQSTPLQWKPNYTLRSHLDSVHCLGFERGKPTMVSCSEDYTLKYWAIPDLATYKQGVSTFQDLEPVYTYRGHSGPVFCVELTQAGSDLIQEIQKETQKDESVNKETTSQERGVCFSAGADCVIRIWSLPDENDDLYRQRGMAVSDKVGRLIGHTDCIWGLSCSNGRRSSSPPNALLASVSADGSIKVWNWLSKQTPLLASFTCPLSSGKLDIPTSVGFLGNNTDSNETQIVVSFQSGSIRLFDIQQQQLVQTISPLSSPSSSSSSSRCNINKVVVHPRLPLLVTAHEDKTIRFHSLTEGQTIHSMVAHLESVTCIDIDPSGLSLVSGSSDGSVRFWDIGSKACVQELNAHRKKFDESVLSVKYHPTLPLLGSCGADSIIKLYQ